MSYLNKNFLSCMLYVFNTAPKILNLTNNIKR